MPWKVQTADDYKKEIKKKVWEVETLREFRDFLRELADSSSFGLIFYGPLADKFDELYDFNRWLIRFALAVGFILGIIAGYCLR